MTALATTPPGTACALPVAQPVAGAPDGAEDFGPVIFRSCRGVGAPGGLPAPLQAEAGGATAGPHTAVAPIRPFKAWVLAWPARRTGAPMHIVSGTIAVLRSDVRRKFQSFYRDPKTGAAQWAKALRDGAKVLRVTVQIDPEFRLPKGMPS